MLFKIYLYLRLYCLGIGLVKIILLLVNFYLDFIIEVILLVEWILYVILNLLDEE